MVSIYNLVGWPHYPLFLDMLGDDAAFPRRDGVYYSDISTAQNYVLYRRRLSRLNPALPWANPTFYPDAMVSSRKAKLRAHVVELQNPKDSKFSKSKVPPEVLLLVVDHLSDVDMLSLRASCRGFHALLFAKTSTVLSEKDKDEVALRLHVDRFQQLAKVERGLGARETKYRLCSACLDLHSTSHFAASELAKGPHKRLCLGSTAKLRICEHISFSFQELFKRCQDPRYFDEDFSQCHTGVTRLRCYAGGRVELTRVFCISIPRASF
ncbi:hypothetical protein BDV95DRAFT_607735 [Massariosphaeria phaeospora]|uniref:F-box domain-containing protein n=1 Tax=Massariosphaeria phaeospora TaxID=100035 RepID=A0A7C8M782_9PLEO|nr:hypothetical protein BDV95DRAFT_607735 [Massariosphaeria phaeospora]